MFKTLSDIYLFFLKQKLNVGKNVVFYGNVFSLNLKNKKNIYLGNNVKINEHVFMFARRNSKIIIDDNTTVSAYSKLVTASYDVNLFLEGKHINEDIHYQKDIYIGKNCWIGMGSIILPGVKLEGSGITVGAGSVVTKSFKGNNMLIAGNPAKIVKQY